MNRISLLAVSLTLSTHSYAAWPILPAGEVICDAWAPAMEQAHYFHQGIDELVKSKSCGRLRADTEYAVIGSEFIRDQAGRAVMKIPLIRIRKNGAVAYHVPGGVK
jgi:hypothetical protein